MTTATLDLATDTLAGSWTIDPSHSNVLFSVKHLMIATVRGAFENVSGTLSAAEGLAPVVQVNVEIDANSVDTRSAQRDAHLRSADFFHTEQFPRITFAGRGVVADVTRDFRYDGVLTIRGVSKPVTLEVSPEGTNRDPWGGERIAFSAKTTINRKDFGLEWNQSLETGGVLVSDEVRISLDIQFVRAQG